jgi:hypothetical protein
LFCSRRRPCEFPSGGECIWILSGFWPALFVMLVVAKSVENLSFFN